MENKKDVIIKIEDYHEEDGQRISSELITVGTLSGSENDYSIVFDEQEEGMENCTTTLRVEEKKRITMTRIGDYNTEMVIEKGQRHNCHYATPYGDFFMGVFAKAVVSDMSQGGVNLKMNYTIDFNSGFDSENEVFVTVEEPSGGNLN